MLIEKVNLTICPLFQKFIAFTGEFVLAGHQGAPDTHCARQFLDLWGKTFDGDNTAIVYSFQASLVSIPAGLSGTGVPGVFLRHLTMDQLVPYPLNALSISGSSIFIWNASNNTLAA